MAKRTLTEEQKKKAAENLAKARAAKKAAKEADASLKVSAEVISSTPAQQQAATGEQGVINAIADDSEEILFIIPPDPSVASEVQWWERSINGHVLRLQRGKPYVLPKYLVNYIQSKIKIRTMSDASVEAFTVGSGKHLNF